MSTTTRLPNELLLNIFGHIEDGWVPALRRNVSRQATLSVLAVANKEFGELALESRYNNIVIIPRNFAPIARQLFARPYLFAKIKNIDFISIRLDDTVHGLPPVPSDTTDPAETSLRRIIEDLHLSPLLKRDILNTPRTSSLVVLFMHLIQHTGSITLRVDALEATCNAPAWRQIVARSESLRDFNASLRGTGLRHMDFLLSNPALRSLTLFGPIGSGINASSFCVSQNSSLTHLHLQMWNPHPSAYKLIAACTSLRFFEFKSEVMYGAQIDTLIGALTSSKRTLNNIRIHDSIEVSYSSNTSRTFKQFEVLQELVIGSSALLTDNANDSCAILRLLATLQRLCLTKVPSTFFGSSSNPDFPLSLLGTAMEQESAGHPKLKHLRLLLELRPVSSFHLNEGLISRLHAVGLETIEVAAQSYNFYSDPDTNFFEL